MSRFSPIVSVAAAAFALVASGCGPDSADAQVVVENAAVLRYAYQPGDSLSYDVHQGVSLSMEGSGDAAFGAATDVTMDMSISSFVDYRFAEGPSPDLTEVTIETSLVGGGATMTAMGRTEVIPLSELSGDLTPTVVLVLDPQGRPVDGSIDGRALPTDLLEDFGAMIGQSASQPQHIGPQFPEEPIGVGSTWETNQDIDLFGMAITQHGQHAVVGEDAVGGRATLRIESTIRTGATRVDLGEALEQMLDSGLAAGSGLDEAEIESMTAMYESMGIEMTMRLDDSRTDMTTWFDPDAGVVVKSVMAGPMSMSLSMRGAPDVGDLEVTMDMVVEQTMELAE